VSSVTLCGCPLGIQLSCSTYDDLLALTFDLLTAVYWNVIFHGSNIATEFEGHLVFHLVAMMHCVPELVGLRDLDLQPFFTLEWCCKLQLSQISSMLNFEFFVTFASSYLPM